MTVPSANETLSLLAVVLGCQTLRINVSESKGNGNNDTTVSLCVQGLCAPCWPGFPSLSVSHTLQVRPVSAANQQPARDDFTLMLKSVNTPLSGLHLSDTQAIEAP